VPRLSAWVYLGPAPGAPTLESLRQLEYYSVVGSLKDRMVYYMMRDAIWRSVVRHYVCDDPYSESQFRTMK
jgi:hypothetical protein